MSSQKKNLVRRVFTLARNQARWGARWGGRGAVKNIFFSKNEKLGMREAAGGAVTRTLARVSISSQKKFWFRRGAAPLGTLRHPSLGRRVGGARRVGGHSKSVLTNLVPVCQRADEAINYP